MRHEAVIEELRARVAGIEHVGPRHDALPFGIADIDDYLPGAGLATGALHEIAGSRALCDEAAATIFLAGVLARLDGPVFWCLRWRDLFAPALDLVGLHPDRVIWVEAGSDTNVLIAMEECLRQPGLAGVVGEIGKIGTTASKRLQLAAESSGVTAFVLRRASDPAVQGQGSAAFTRWRVQAAPSERLDIPALARARWRVALERARGREPRTWLLEACDAQGRLALPARLVDRPAAQEERRIAV
ncbi:ImuA family protein [Sphingomonas oryzagri]|uniref:Damage-inducible mutagenesis protein n=1 Tax=Sphingomonas oryzagri TaxID=3042314 RepID=A0ABT6N576_9SPHN|nr:damage-inducible mutagenesis protein [Sphingomonas oryzagri]MDH7640257.1 damage-inducible mutagenesis protein [Sphingomonas oryzagri]